MLPTNTPERVPNTPRSQSAGTNAHQRLGGVYFLAWEAKRLDGDDAADAVFRRELTRYAQDYIPGGVSGLSEGLKSLLRDGLPR